MVVVVVVVVVDVDVVVVGSSFKNQEQKRTVLTALETGQYRALCKHPANGINPERRSEDGRQTKLGATLHPLACKPAPETMSARTLLHFQASVHSVLTQSALAKTLPNKRVAGCYGTTWETRIYIRPNLNPPAGRGTAHAHTGPAQTVRYFRRPKLLIHLFFRFFVRHRCMTKS